MAVEIQVTIGAISFNTTFTPNMYLLRNTEEILDALRTRRSDTPKQGEHGSKGSLSSYEPRILVFRGEIRAQTQAQRVQMQQNLDKELALSRLQSFDGDDGYKLVQIVDEDGVAKQIYAKIDQMPHYEVIEEGEPEDRRFEFTMFAEDPTVYAQSLVTEEVPESYATTTFTYQDGDLPVYQDGNLPTYQDVTGIVLEFVNTGNYYSPPLITLNGPLLNPVIRNETTGYKLEFSRNGGLELLEGESVVINAAAASAVKDAVSVRSKLSLDSVFFDIAPGSNFITLMDESENDLSGAMELTFRPAWI